MNGELKKQIEDLYTEVCINYYNGSPTFLILLNELIDLKINLKLIEKSQDQR